MQELKIDPEFKNLLPALTEEEYRDLEDNLVTNGFDAKKYGAIIIWGDTIIDGHNRYEIWQKHNIEPVIESIEFTNRDAAIDWIINNQFSRRNLTDERRDYLRGLQYNREKGKHGGDQKSNRKIDGSVADKLAEQHKVSPRTIERDGAYAEAVNKIGEDAGEKVKQDILAGKTKMAKKDVVMAAKKESAEEIKEAMQNSDGQEPERPKKAINNQWDQSIELLHKPVSSFTSDDEAVLQHTIDAFAVQLDKLYAVQSQIRYIKHSVKCEPEKSAGYDSKREFDDIKQDNDISAEPEFKIA